MEKIPEKERQIYRELEDCVLTEEPGGILRFENNNPPGGVIVAYALFALGILLLLGSAAGWYFFSPMHAAVFGILGLLCAIVAATLYLIVFYSTKRSGLPRMLWADGRAQWWLGPQADPLFSFADTHLMLEQTGARPPRGMLWYWLYLQSPRGRSLLFRSLDYPRIMEIADRLETMGVGKTRRGIFICDPPKDLRYD